MRVRLTTWQQVRLWLAGLVGSRYDGLRHFHVVEPGVLMRCGQPRLRDLETIQRTHGLRTIFCARGGTRHPLRGRWFRRQRRWCAAAGVTLVHAPFSDAATPPAEIFERFLALVADPERRPVLVHCEQGFHRTGILCAAHRIRHQGWTPQDALAELESLGFERAQAKRRPLLEALERWLSDVAAPTATAAAGARYDSDKDSDKPTVVAGGPTGWPQTDTAR